MKCKGCNDTGEAEYTNGIFSWKSTCHDCQGKGYIESLTNEEYMQTCSSDELANTIFRLIIHGTVIRPDREYIKRWLKEKHHD